MKKCRICNLAKEEILFAKRTKLTYRNECKECWNKLKEPIESARKKALQDYVFSYLQAHPCVDCGETNPVLLEFDHMDPSKKRYGICYIVCSKLSMKHLIEEVSLCEVRCANCHRFKSAIQNSYWILDYLDDKN
jgi:hypothetical protein